MSDRAKKISELTSLTTVSGGDLLVIVDDPSGTAVTKKTTVNAVFSTFTPSEFNVGDINVNNHVHYSVSNAQFGNTSPITSANYQTDATLLETNKQVQMLHSLDNGQNNYYLPDGMQGEVMFFVPMHSTNMDSIFIWMDNIRAYNLINVVQGAAWLPFNSTDAKTVAIAIFTDGAWNIDNSSIVT